MPRWERNVIIVLFVVLVAVGLLGCTPPPDIDRAVIEGKTKQQKENDSPTLNNMQSIADVLGCVFAPQTCKKTK
jgi:hypothetical protein